MRVGIRISIAVLTCLATLSWTAFAHHGVSMYNMNADVTLKGTVTEFRLANPHTEIVFRVNDKDKGPIDWTAESGSANMLFRAGWRKDSLKPGDEITVFGHPAKDSQPFVNLMKLILSDGRELSPPNN